MWTWAESRCRWRSRSCPSSSIRGGYWRTMKRQSGDRSDPAASAPDKAACRSRAVVDLVSSSSSPRRTRFVSHVFTFNSSLTLGWNRAVDKSLERSLSPRVSIASAQEPMCGMMPQVDTAELPHELVNIEVAAKVPEIDCALNELGQRDAPLTFHFKDLVLGGASNAMDLKQSRRHRTSSRQAGTLRPSEPIANQRPQARKAFACLHRGLENMHRSEFRHMRQQFDLNVLFRSEMRE